MKVFKVFGVRVYVLLSIILSAIYVSVQYYDFKKKTNDFCTVLAPALEYCTHRCTEDSYIRAQEYVYRKLLEKGYDEYRVKEFSRGISVYCILACAKNKKITAQQIKKEVCDKIGFEDWLETQL